MEFGRLYYTIGLPRSGKSTFAAQWSKSTTGGEKRVWLSGDHIRLATHGHRFIATAEPTVHTHKYVAIKALLLSGHNVLYDGTNTTKESLFEIWKIDQIACPIWIPQQKIIASKQWIDHIDTCKKRAVETNQADLLSVIDRQAIQLMDLNINFNRYREEFDAYLTHKRYKTFRQRMTKHDK
jgi:hypothetical protein